MKQIVKRDGTREEANFEKIKNAVLKAFNEFGMIIIPEEVENELGKMFMIIQDTDVEITVEMIQDRIEVILMECKYYAVAKSYITYRHIHSERRHIINNINDIINGYLKQKNWRVKENANASFSYQGLNNHISGYFISEYWKNNIYTNKKIKEAHESGAMHIHDLSALAVYCCGWSIEDLLLNGFGGVDHAVESKPANHLDTALGQLVNYLYTLQGEAAGAQAVSSFDTYMAPFIRKDNLTYKQVKSAIRTFLFNMNIPTRVGFQVPFSNVTMDVTVTESAIAEDYVIMGGQYQSEQYKEFQQEVDIFNMAFCDVMMEGDKKGTLYAFPIPTYNITENFDWDSPVSKLIFEMTGKYGIPYFANYVNSDMKPSDARSMCCRLRLDNTELRKRGGGLFGSNPLTGSIGVVTLNLPQLAYRAKQMSESSEEHQMTSKEIFNKLIDYYMELAKDSLEVKRVFLERSMIEGLYPYARYALRDVYSKFNEYFKNHFSTIGIVGAHEACINLFDVGIDSPGGKRFIENILERMRNRMRDFQEETGNLYNLEATPAEGTSYRLAIKDQKRYNEEIYSSGTNEPFYTNSSQLPQDYTYDIFEALEHQETLQTKYTGGTVFHSYIGERISGDQAKLLVKKITDNFEIPYVSITPTFSICKDHGYINGEVWNCPECGEECKVYTRVVGFYRPIQSFNNGKVEEKETRKDFTI
jgi:anaerobic ribonucleoside-triphosphate reductase